MAGVPKAVLNQSTMGGKQLAVTNDAVHTHTDATAMALPRSRLGNISDMISQAIIIETPVPCGPGTGTPGYWMNHPDAWPVNSVTVGNTTFTKAEAIALMKAPTKKDMRYVLFAALVSAKLNIFIGNEGSCVEDVITLADAWWVVNGGSPVAASSAAWKTAEPYSTTLDDYNNGLLCAPHRD